jgi:hypothetical protein
MAFQKGHKKVGGKKKGSRNKSTVLLEFAKEITAEEKQILFREVYNQTLELVRAKNVTIINTLINKMFPNLEPEAAKNPFGDNKPKTITIEFVG